MSQSSSQQARIAVIDTAINDYQALVDAARIKGQAIILVSPGSSGLSQLADALDGYSDVASISIFSHGRAGLLELGSDQVTADNISLYEETLTQISASLRDGADILLYGCEVGADEAGLALIERLSQLIGADVAASDDLTGNEEFGGDWELEIRHGDIDASVQDGSVSLRGFNSFLASSYTINFDHSGATTNYDASSDNDAEIPVSNYTFVVDGERTGVKIYDYNAPFEYYATIGGNGDAYETQVTMKFDGGETFNITSLALRHYGDGEEVFTISSDKSDSKQVTQGEGGDGFETITLNWSNISELYITSNDKKMSVNIDNIELDSITSTNTPLATSGTNTFENTKSGFATGDTSTASADSTNESAFSGFVFSAHDVDGTSDGSAQMRLHWTKAGSFVNDSSNLITGGRVFFNSVSTTSREMDYINIAVEDGYVVDFTSIDVAVYAQSSNGDNVTATIGAYDINGNFINSTQQVLTVGAGASVFAAQRVSMSGFTGAASLKISVNNDVQGFSIDNLSWENAGLPVSNNAPTFVNSGPFSVSESASNSTKVGDVNANDGDGGGNDVNVTYSIISGNPNIDSDGNSGFAIDSNTGVITVNDADDIDYETATSHSLTVRAEDTDGATKDQTVTINVTDALDTNNALYFDSDASVTGLDGIGQSPANFTIEFNLYLDVGISDWAGIYWSSTDDEAGVYLNSNRQIEIWNDQSFFIRAVPALDLESWTHVAITYSGPGTLKVYLDGVEAQLYLDESNSDESVYLPTNDVQMGGSSYNLGNSALDDFRVWNETRTSTQINDNKGAELTAPFSSSLQRYYDFNHGTGGENNAGETTLVERTGNGNDGTLNNFSLSGDTSNFVEKSSLQASTNVPSLTATGADPTFTENGSAVTLFSAADANTNDTDQTITGITLTVTNVSNGAAESLTIAGTTVSLTNSNSGAIGSGGNFSVSVTGVTATVTLTNLARTEAQMDTLLQGITYNNTSDAPGTDARVITVTQVTDSGGSNNSASVSQASTVSITAVNDVPTATNLTKTVQYNDSDNSVALDDIVVTDPDAGDTITATLTLSATGAGSLSTGAFGSSKSTYDSDTGVWTVSGTVTDVNAALADVAFTPTSSWNQDSSITTHIHDGNDTGPANGLITLDVTDTTAPTVTLLGLQSPGSNITNSDTLVWRVDFSESVKGIDATDFTVSGTTATVTNVTDQGNNTYYVTASGGDLASYDGAVALSFSGGQNIEDANGNALTNTTPTGTNNNSYTLDNTAPTFDGFHSSPADNGFFADLTSDITLRFSENIDWGNGNITLWNITDSDNHTIVESFDVADAEGGISGQNWKLEPAQDLSAGSSYSIRIDSTAVEDMAGNTFAGISDDTTYNFSTAPYVELSVDSSSVAEDGGVATVTATLKDALGNTVQATDTVTLDLSTSSDSAVWGDDYSLNTKLSITAGQSSASTKLTSTGDSLSEGNETATISIASVNNAIEDGDQEVTVTLVENEAPDVDLNGSAGEGGNTSFSYSEGDSATVVAPSATLTDSNNDDITSMTVTLTARPDGDATETLALSTLAATAADNEGLSVNYTESTGVLLVSGQASASVYQSVLRGVTYVNTSQNPTESDREVTVVANDGTANSQSSKVTISVTAENDAPVLDDSKELSLTQIAEDLSSPDKDSTNNSTLVSELTTGVTDVDGDNDLGIAITAANSTEGTLWYSLDDGKQWSQVGAVSEAQALWLDADDRLYWQPNANTHGKVDEVLTFRATDRLLGGERGSVANNGGASHYSSATDTVSVTVESVNDAPTVTAHANYSMSGINEDTTSGETTVSTLLTGVGYSDADSGDESGIAVTSLSGNGTWQYDAQDDDNWTDMPSVSQSDALLLSAATKLRYVPDGENGEKPSIEFRAWDQDSGTASTNGNAQTADVSTSGGSTAFSVNSASGSFIVSAVNDAPVLDDTEKPTLLSVDEDLAGPSDGSTSNSTLVSALTAGVSDVDTNANKGIAITAVDDTSGTLHYSTDDGVTWNTVSGVSADNALLLSADDRLYWQPDAQVNGKVDSVITFRAWDQSSGVAGNFADTSSGGDTAAFSTATDTIAVTVNAINDAPTFSSTSYNMTATNEDKAQTVNVSDLLTSLGYADVEQASGGVAVVENSGSGDWEYSTDAGTSWHDLGSTEVTSAVLLNNTAQLRYTPVGDNAESDVALKVRAWDGNEGTASSGATRNTADTTLTGGDTAFSSQQASVTLDVTALNDAPTLSAGSNLMMTSIDEDSTSATLTVSQLLTNAGYADVDSGAAQGLALVTASGSGQWQYSSDNKTWNTVDSVSNANALLLDADTELRYVGDGIKGGAAILGFHAWDTTTGSHASTVDLSEGTSKGGTSAFSSDSGVATLIVSSVNDAPVLDNTKELSLTPIAEDLSSPEGNSTDNSTLVSELTTGVTDVDGDTNLGIAITATNSSKGTLWYSLNDGDSWSEVGTVSDTSALLLDSKHRLYWQPAENENGTVSDAFTFRAIDSLLGGESGNVSTNGGTTHYSTATDTVSVTVSAVNDAPTVTAHANHSMTGTDENTTSGETTVSALLAGVGYSDADASAQSGIAVTSLSGNGTWQYDAQNDGNWADMPSVAESGALLLSAATKLRYVPDGENGEKPSIEFRAWDQTSGAASTNGSPQTVDVSTHGAATAFSANTASGSFIVSAVNDAPVLDNTKVLSLTTINEDLVAPTGTGDLVNAMEVVNLTGGISDVDTGASKGIAITAVNNTDGKLFYSLDGGSHWSEVTGVTESNALLLESSNHLYWQPSANANGTVSDAVTIRAWDDTSGEGGDFVDTSTNGGTTAFSTATDTVQVAVNPVNDAPTINAGPHALNATNEDTTSSATTVSDLMNSLGYDDIDSSDWGIAITSAGGNGEWEYSTDSGTTWHSVGSVSATSSLLLLAAHQVRYQPDEANAESSVTLNVRGWDGTSGAASSGATRGTADTSTNGGSTAFSSQQGSVTINVSAVNDAPTINASTEYTMASVNEDANSTATVAVSAILTNAGLADVDTGALSGLVITGESARGDWEYSLDSGKTWSAVSDVSTSAALALSSTDLLRYAPDAERGEEATLTYQAWDQTTGNAGDTLDVSTNGGTTAYSQQSGTVSVDITDVNDDPTGTVTIAGQPYTGTTLTAEHDVADVDGVDLDGFKYVWRADGVVIANETESTLVLGASQLNKKITVTVEYTDLNKTSESVSSDPTAVIQLPPEPPADTSNDGATVNKSTETRDDGTTVDVTDIEIVTEDREEETGDENEANVPVVTEDDERLLEVGLPTGSGMRIESEGTGTGANGLIQAIRARTNGDGQQQDQQELTGSGNSFLDDLPDPDTLVVRTLVPKVANNTPTAPIKVSGTPAGSKPVAVVIDTTELPTGQMLILDSVQFGAIIGEVIIIGGTGQNSVTGDGRVQIMVLGEDDDVLRGGGGDDLVGSRGGDDMLYGDAGNDKVIGGAGNDTLEGGSGNDILQGGASDAGEWTFSLKDNQLVSRFNASDVVATDTETFELVGPWFTEGSSGLETDTRLQFSYADNARLELVATLYRAAVGEKASLMDFNTFVSSDLSSEALANEAVNFYFNSQGLVGQALEVQVTMLIEAVWGEGSASDALIAEGVNFLSNGGSWADAMLILAQAEQAEQLLENEDGELVLVQTYQTSETGWSSATGDDILRGGTGNDRLVGGDGNDLLDGGEGTDVAVFTGGAGDFTFQVVFSDAAEVGAQPAQLLLTRTVNGETDTLQDIELLKIGGHYFELNADLSGYAEGTDYALVEIIGQLSVEEVNAIGLAGVY